MINEGNMTSPVETLEEKNPERGVDGSVIGTESDEVESLETDISTTDSKWAALSEEAEGIEMLF